jgi:hypothetical protein
MILATWETEIRSIAIPGQLWQKKIARPHLNRKKVGVPVTSTMTGIIK